MVGRVSTEAARGDWIRRRHVLSEYTLAFGKLVSVIEKPPKEAKPEFLRHFWQQPPEAGFLVRRLPQLVVDEQLATDKLREYNKSGRCVFLAR